MHYLTTVEYRSGKDFSRIPAGRCHRCGRKHKLGDGYNKFASLMVSPGGNVDVFWAEFCAACGDKIRKLIRPLKTAEGKWCPPKN